MMASLFNGAQTALYMRDLEFYEEGVGIPISR